MRASYAAASRSVVTVHGSTGHKGPMVTLPVRVPVPPPESGAAVFVLSRYYCDYDGNSDKEDDEQGAVKTGFWHNGLIAVIGKKSCGEVLW